MAILSHLIHLFNFHSPLLRAIVPPATAVAVIQSAFAVPSIAAQSAHFYDFSGSVAFLAVAALSLYLPVLRARSALDATGHDAPGLPSLFAPFTVAGVDAAWNWRQVICTGAVTLWAIRLGTYLFLDVLSASNDSRFDGIRRSPFNFAVAFSAQAVWVILSLMPLLILNAVPAATLTTAIPRLLLSDVVGLGMWTTGFMTEAVADSQKRAWLKAKLEKAHDEHFITSGLFSRSRYPHYFGEITLWAGLATAVAGVSACRPVQYSLGLSGGQVGILVTTILSFVSPAFSAYLLLSFSAVPLSEKKHDARYGNREDYQEWKRNTPRLIPRLW